MSTLTWLAYFMRWKTKITERCAQKISSPRGSRSIVDKKELHSPGIEPGPIACLKDYCIQWKAMILPMDHKCLLENPLCGESGNHFETKIYKVRVKHACFLARGSFRAWGSVSDDARQNSREMN